MPHAAAQFVAGVRQRREPDETAADIEAEVDAARVTYSDAKVAAYDQYQGLTGGGGFSLLSVTPNTGPADTSVQIAVVGAGFDGTESLYFDEDAQEAYLEGDTFNVFIWYPDPGVVQITARRWSEADQADVSTNAIPFTFT
jgi:hypothetical protein